MQEHYEQSEADVMTTTDKGSIDSAKFPAFLRKQSKFSFGMASDGGDQGDPRQMYTNFGIMGRTPTERKILFGTTTAVSLIACMFANDQMKKSDERAAVQRAADYSALQKRIAEDAKKREVEERSKQTATAKPVLSEGVSNEEDEGIMPLVMPESVWATRAPGEIKKGEIIYSPVKGADGKEKFASLQFVDKDSQTLLIMNGKKWAQTSRGFPVFVTKILLGADGKITIEGRILRGLSGVSTWDAQRVSKLNDDLEYDGKSEFTVATFLGDEKGLIQMYTEPEVASSDDEVETESSHEKSK